MLQQNLYQSNIELIFRKLKGETINHKVLHDKTRKLVNTKTYSLQCLSMDKFTCIHPHYLMYGDKIIPYLNQRDLLINECYSREGNLHKTIAILQKFFWWQTLKEDVYMNYTYSGHNIPRRLLIENQNVWIYNLRSSRLTSSIQILEVQNQMENYSAGQFLSEGSIVQGGKDYSFVYTDGKTMQISNKLLFPQISIRLLKTDYIRINKEQYFKLVEKKADLARQWIGQAPINQSVNELKAKRESFSKQVRQQQRDEKRRSARISFFGGSQRNEEQESEARVEIQDQQRMSDEQDQI